MMLQCNYVHCEGLLLLIVISTMSCEQLVMRCPYRGVCTSVCVLLICYDYRTCVMYD